MYRIYSFVEMGQSFGAFVVWWRILQTIYPVHVYSTTVFTERKETKYLCSECDEVVFESCMSSLEGGHALGVFSQLLWDGVLFFLQSQRIFLLSKSQILN